MPWRSLLALTIFKAGGSCSPRPLLPTPIASPNAQTFLLIFGVGETAATKWDGSIAATGGTILSLAPRRFLDTDSIKGTSSWTITARMTSAGPNETGTDLFQENGLIVTVAQSQTRPSRSTSPRRRCNFSFTSQDVTFGNPGKSFLNGPRVDDAHGARCSNSTSSPEEEDFPAMAQSGDDVYLAYTRFVHGDRTLATSDDLKTVLTDFNFLEPSHRYGPDPAHALLEGAARLDRAFSAVTTPY